MKNACIVGYGAIGPAHARAIEKTENAKLYAVCDINPLKNQLCQQTYNVKTYTDFYQMLEDKNIDNVHICTPHYLHYEMITAALKAGKHVVAEKPMVMTRNQFESLLKTPGINDVCLIFQNRLNPCAQKLRSIIEKGILGHIICAKAIVTWRRTKEYYKKDNWRGKWDTEGGGVLINQAVHTLDMLHYLVGDIKSVQANMTNYSLNDTIEVEDTVSAYFEFACGATGIFFATNAYKVNSPQSIEIVFEQGIARYTGNKLYINDEIVCEDVVPTGEKSYWGLGHYALMHNYYDCNQYFNIFDAENTMNALFAIYESAQSGKSIKIQV